MDRVPGRILVRLPNPLGDAVMATPALRALRRGFPDAEIALLALPHFEGLLRGVESFDRFVPYRGRGLRDLIGRAGALRRELLVDDALGARQAHDRHLRGRDYGPLDAAAHARHDAAVLWIRR